MNWQEWGLATEHALELRNSLEEMLNAALEEELPSDEVRQRAMRVFLKAKGLA